MATISIKGMSCNHCVMAVTKALNEVDGIKDMKLPRPKGRGFCLAAVLRTPVRKIDIFV
jgi:copper chaperone CopZ